MKKSVFSIVCTEQAEVDGVPKMAYGEALAYLLKYGRLITRNQRRKFLARWFPRAQEVATSSDKESSRCRKGTNG